MFQDIQTARTTAPDMEFLKSLLSLFKEQTDLILAHCLHTLMLVSADRMRIAYTSLGW